MHHVRMTDAAGAAAGAWADETSATFRVADPLGDLDGVRLVQDVRIPAEHLTFGRKGGYWELEIKRPPLNRMEYRLELSHRNGRREVVQDPANPRNAQGAFCTTSVLQFPEYEPPSWLSAQQGAGPGSDGPDATFDVPATALGVPVPVRLWTPPGSADDERLPLLVVNDGPEYDSLAMLTRYLSAGITGGWLPRLRAALLGPGERDDWYSANARYARGVHHAVLPAIASKVATSVRIGMGTSLGALAMLHAHCQYPDSFDALFLQSGSFFVARLDPQERRFRYFERIVRFVGRVHSGGILARPVPTVLTCGAIEENIENNRLMTRTLLAQGYDAELHEVPDMHNYTAWRDAFDPFLSGLLRHMGQGMQVSP